MICYIINSIYFKTYFLKSRGGQMPSLSHFWVPMQRSNRGRGKVPKGFVAEGWAEILLKGQRMTKVPQKELT